MQKTKKAEKKKSDRFVSVTLNIVAGQAEILDRISQITGQTRTDIIREALAMYLPNLYIRLTSKENNQNEMG